MLGLISPSRRCELSQNPGSHSSSVYGLSTRWSRQRLTTGVTIRAGGRRGSARIVDLHIVMALTSRKPQPLAPLGLPFFILTAALVVTIASGAAPPPGSSITLISDSEPGQRLTIHGRVVGEGGKPVAGARLHVYQTDASGHYTPDKPMDEPHARLAGWLQTGKDGRFELHTIRPGGYPKAVRLGGRDRKIPAHVHIDITADGYAPRKVQAVFSDDPLLSDPYWQDWVRAQGHPVVTVSRSAAGQVADLVVALRRASSH
jgi:hypothetical protein